MQENSTALGGIVMSERKCTHIKVLEPEIVKMRAAGVCKRAIAGHFGLDTEQAKELLKG